MLKRKAKIFKAARGFYGRRKNCWTQAVRSVHKAWQYAYIGRKLKKRDFRSQWIMQINAAARAHGLSYSIFMQALPATGMQMNRKVLAELAGTEPATFRAIAEAVKLVGAGRAGGVTRGSNSNELR